MSNNQKVSIIIPFYNAEKFIDKTIESILSQSYENLEVLLINDGSTDNTSAVVNKYITSDNRIKLFEKENGGPSAARNYGLEKITGDYIMFIDADDYIDHNMVEVMVDLLQDDIQMGMCGYNVIRENNITIKRVPESQCFSQNELFENFGVLFKQAFIQYLWNKIYLVKLIKENNIKFDDSIRYGEDILFNLEYLRKLSHIRITDKALYHYIKYNDESITKNYNPALYKTWNYIFMKIKNVLNEFDAYNINLTTIEDLYMKRLIACINNLFLKGAPKEKTIIISEMEIMSKNDELLQSYKLKNSDNIKNKIILGLLKRNMYEAIYYGAKLYIRTTK